jgi:hypothetical protein
MSEPVWCSCGERCHENNLRNGALLETTIKERDKALYMLHEILDAPDDIRRADAMSDARTGLAGRP